MFAKQLYQVITPNKKAIKMTTMSSEQTVAPIARDNLFSEMDERDLLKLIDYNNGNKDVQIYRFGCIIKSYFPRYVIVDKINKLLIDLSSNNHGVFEITVENMAWTYSCSAHFAHMSVIIYIYYDDENTQIEICNRSCDRDLYYEFYDTIKKLLSPETHKQILPPNPMFGHLNEFTDEIKQQYELQQPNMYGDLDIHIGTIEAIKYDRFGQEYLLGKLFELINSKIISCAIFDRDDFEFFIPMDAILGFIDVIKSEKCLLSDERKAEMMDILKPFLDQYIGTPNARECTKKRARKIRETM